jgi:pantoate--beta-alanine ligase
MARDLCLDVEIVGAPLVRDPDGLAMSSRNAYLSPEDRVRARALSRGLRAAGALFDAGVRAGPALLGAVRAELAGAGLEPEYLELRRATDLAPLEVAEGPAVILLAARAGSTRLLDNLILSRT